MNEFVIPIKPVLVFLVVLARVGGIVTFAPLWSHRMIPAKVRAALALALSILITPAAMARIPEPPQEFFGLAVVIAGEMVIGLVFGLAARLVFAAVEMAASVLTYQMGLSLASTIDPATQANSTALGILAQMFAMIILLGMDGHHWPLVAAYSSFASVAPGSFQITGDLADAIIRMSASTVSAGVALAAPAIVVLLAVEFGLAIAGRAAPQLQVLVLGFPIKIAAGLWLLGASLYFLPGAVRTVLYQLRDSLARLL